VDKKIILTGASSGVGLSIAAHLVECGYEIITISRRKNVAKQKINSNNITSYRCDLTNLSNVKNLLIKIIRTHGYIPYLINNAGGNLKVNFFSTKVEDYRYLYNLNAFAPALIMKCVLSKMVENNFGRIINVTSGAPLDSNNNSVVYASSKASLNAITVAAANECKNYNIKINLMSPGPVKSEMAPDALLEPAICHPTIDYLLSIGSDGPSGKFFWLGYEIPLFPDLSGIRWLEGKASSKYRRVTG